MRTSRYIKTILGILVILAIVGGIGFGISYIIQNQKPAIYFITEMGDPVEDLYADKGTVVTLPQPNPVDGYQFEGWYYDSNHTNKASNTMSMPNNKTMLYAKWSIKSYTLTFDYNDGITKEAKLVRQYGAIEDVSLYAPYDATLGYNCVWKKIVGNDAITVDLTKKVEFTENMTFRRFEEPKTYPIKFVYLDEEFTEVELEQTTEVEFNSYFNISDIDGSRNGYTFENWKLADDTIVNNSTLLDGEFPGLASLNEIKLIGQYRKNQYKLYFTDEVGNQLKGYDIEYLSGVSTDILDEINSNTSLIKQHYNLTGWQLNTTGVDFNEFIMPYYDVELSPVYTAKQYSVRFYTIFNEEIEIFKDVLTYNESLDGVVPNDALIQQKIDSDAYKLDKLQIDTTVMDLATFYDTYTNIEGDLNIQIILNKFKLFVNYYSNQITLYKSVKIEKGLPVVLPADPPVADAPTPKDVGSNAVFGGWILGSGAIFDEDYNLDNLTDDIMVYADWYEESKTLWQYKISSNNYYITGFTGQAEKIATPSKINIGTVADPVLVDVYGMGSIGVAGMIPVSGLTNKSILITNNVRHIAEEAFYNIQGLKVKFSKGTYQDASLTISEYAFASSIMDDASQYSISEIRLPARLTSVDEKAFYNAKDLLSITVDSTCLGFTSIDGVLYEVNGDELTLVVYPRMKTDEEFTLPANCSAIGNYAFYYLNTNNNSYVAKLIKVITPEDSILESVGDYAFQGNPQLQLFDATTATDLTSIGAYAFECLFSENNSYEQYGVLIPSKLTAIGDAAFKKTVYIKDLKLDLTNLNSIGVSAFEECAHTIGYNNTVRSISLGGNITKISDNAFLDCKLEITVVSGNKISEIGATAFMNVKFVTAVFDNLITSISTGALHNVKASELTLNIATIPASMLTNAVINKLYLNNVATIESNGLYAIDVDEIVMLENCTITTIPASCFNENTFLVKITLPNSVTIIDNGAFNGCTSLTTVNLPDSIEKINQNAFNGCNKLNNLDFGDSLKSIGLGAFQYCTSLTELVFPNSLETISGSAFMYCSNIKNITFPKYIKSIGSYAFQDVAITNVKFHCTETLFGHAFVGCTQLKNVTITANLIQGNAFADCTNLSSVSIVLENSATLYANIFANCDNLRYVILDGVVPKLEKHANYNVYAFHDDTHGNLLTNVKIYVANKANYLANSIMDTYYSEMLEQVTISDGMVINSGKLLRAYDATTITLDNTITSIDIDAFGGCSSLTKIQITSNTLIQLDGANDLFATVDLDNLVIEVPSALYDSYIADANWALYKDYIQVAV